MKFKLENTFAFFSKRLLKGIMKILMLLSCVTIFGFSPNTGFTQNIDIDNDKTISVEDVFKIIKGETGYEFIYRNDLIANAPKVSLKKGAIEVNALLNQALNPIHCQYELTENTIIVKEKQKYPILKGKVTDVRGMPIPGVNIIVKSLTFGVSSDFDGMYRLPIKKNGVIVFSALSFKTQEIKTEGLPVGADGDILLNIQLEDDVQALDEVLIVSDGYRTLNREKEAGAYVSVSGKQLESQITNDVLSTLEGLAPGLTLNNDSSTAPALFIRGIGSFGNVTPLFVLDGQPISLDNLNLINPQDIDNVVVLKDAAAASIYGSGAANGVIVITTKRGKGVGSKPVFSFRNSFLFTAKPSLSSLNTMNSRETIDFQKDWFNNSYTNTNNDPLYPRAYDVFFDYDDGLITENQMNTRLDALASYDNTKDLEDAVFNNTLQQLYNLSFSGQTDKINYYGSVALNKTDGLFNGDDSKSVNTILNADYNFTKSTVLSLGINYLKDDNTASPLTDYRLSPYERIYDENGNPATNVRREYLDDANQELGFSDANQELGLGLGTKDLSYSLLNVLEDETHKNKKSSTRYNLKLNQDIIANELSASVSFQYLNSNYQQDDLFRENSFYTRNLISSFRGANVIQDPTPDPEDPTKLLNPGKMIATDLQDQIIPDGSILKKRFNSQVSTTARAQLNYNKSFNENAHQITATAGVERRKTVIESDGTTYFGYNEANLLFSPVDLATIPEFNFRALSISENYIQRNNFYNTTKRDTRESGIYLNLNYTLLNKYSFNGSTRRDRSSTFSNDKEYLGSVGFKWNIHKENFMSNVNWINKLDFRSTWGVVGNSAAIGTASTEVRTYASINFITGEQSLNLSFPANKDLTFEVVKTTNLGLDFGLFKNNRITGSFDIYRKISTGVIALGDINSATHGFFSIEKNTADITNEGIEVGLRTKNIITNNFSWTSQISYSTFKNNVDNNTGSNNLGADQLAARSRNVLGNPMNTIWAYEWAGLDEEGRSQAYYTNEAGERAKTIDVDNIQKEDLVIMGSTIPTTTIGFMNTFKYKGFQLYARFAYNAGNTIRRENVILGSQASGTSTISKQALGYWKNPGDENTTNIPALKWQGDFSTFTIRNNSSINYMSGDYIKLRQVALSYSVDSEVMKKTPFTNLNIALQGDNLWYWAKNDQNIDPEAYTNFDGSGGSRRLNIPATYSLRVSLNF
ncbi:SusC/RagA family TonB-linked outer membrane protein [Thalassobellus citreus]|uniref:SusC/RagA family TonB-linked outer membrane protein n=1 Tax=Thalassobellus citreus TaxID=3367752 RepID=UPI0037933D56